MDEKEKTLAIRCGLLIDGTGRDPVKDTTVLVKGSKIAEIGDVSAPTEAEVIDAGEMTVMPGMIDVHVHLNMDPSVDRLGQLFNPDSYAVMVAARNARLTLECGFTLLGHVGYGENGMAGLSLRRAVEDGLVPGPRLWTTGALINQTGGHGDITPRFRKPGIRYTASGPWDVREAVREQVRLGVDYVKTTTTGGVASIGDEPGWRNFTLDECEAMGDEAHAFGLRIQSHAQGLEGVRNAVLAGHDHIEHGFCIDDEVAEMMVKKGTFLFATLGIVDLIAKKKLGGPNAIRKASTYQQIHIRSFKRALDTGVKIAFGTDASGTLFPHGENALEFQYLTQQGMSPMQAIVSATKTAADSFGLLPQLGTIETGKLADLIILKGDPLKDIDVLNDKGRIRKVVKNGEVVVDRDSWISQISKAICCPRLTIPSEIENL